jgi:hypothetical protein
LALLRGHRPYGGIPIQRRFPSARATTIVRADETSAQTGLRRLDRVVLYLARLIGRQIAREEFKRLSAANDNRDAADLLHSKAGAETQGGPTSETRERERSRPMTRVTLCARYSSDNQREASIEDQFRICREHAVRERFRDQRSPQAKGCLRYLLLRSKLSRWGRKCWRKIASQFSPSPAARKAMATLRKNSRSLMGTDQPQSESSLKIPNFWVIALHGIAALGTKGSLARCLRRTADQRAARHQRKRRAGPAVSANSRCATDLTEKLHGVFPRATRYEGESRLPFKMRRSRCGVTGSCVTAPGIPIASSMADAIAAPTPVMPLSPAPLMPSGLSGLA